MEHLRIKIDNVKCDGCENTVKNALTAIGGLDNIVVSSKDGNVELDFDGNEKTVEKIITTLTGIGYPKTN